MVGNQYHKRVLPQRQFLQFVHKVTHATVGISKRIEYFVIQTVVRNIEGFVAAQCLYHLEPRLLTLVLPQVREHLLEQ